MTVTVSLDEGPERSVTIPLTATNAGGASDSDYTLSAASVTFTGSETSKTFTVTAVEDALAESGEQVVLGFGELPAVRRRGARRRRR